MDNLIVTVKAVGAGFATAFVILMIIIIVGIENDNDNDKNTGSGIGSGATTLSIMLLMLLTSCNKVGVTGWVFIVLGILYIVCGILSCIIYLRCIWEDDEAITVHDLLAALGMISLGYFGYILLTDFGKVILFKQSKTNNNENNIN